MTDRFFIDSGQLVSSSYEWREHADTLDGAAQRTGEAATSGFPAADVVGAADTFKQRWSTMVGSLRDTSRTFEDKMLTASQAYAASDYAAQEAFEAWLVSMGEGS